MKSTNNYLSKIKKLSYFINNTDALLIGAGAGLSTSAGYKYDGERFYNNFSDFINKYGFKDMYSAGFYNFSSLEEYWAYWSRYIYINRYIYDNNIVYDKLVSMIKNKNYFVLTTNVDHKFQQAGIDKTRLFYTQGDYGLLQCSKPCNQNTYDNKDMIINMVNNQHNMKVPSELVPYCSLCKSPLLPNLRADNTFVMDNGWYQAQSRYSSFIKQYSSSKITLLELGVGYNSPAVIKYPFWQMAYSNENSIYVSVNLYEAACPKELIDRSICFNNDIGEVLSDLNMALKETS